MKLTKYEHACLDISEGNDRLIICPGEFSASLTDFIGITAVVITHIHGDHFDPKKVETIIENNPDAIIFTTKETAEKIASNTRVPTIGKTYNAGSFTLEFYGEMHAEIDSKTPLVQNIGVLVSNKLYYPGDSLTPCNRQFELLAVPSSAPWLKVGDTAPFIEDSDCKMVIPTHNALWGELGHATANRWQTLFAERSGKEFKYLQTGESIEV